MPTEQIHNDDPSYSGPLCDDGNPDGDHPFDSPPDSDRRDLYPASESVSARYAGGVCESRSSDSELEVSPNLFTLHCMGKS